MDERGESDRYAAKLTRRSALVFGASVLAAWCVSGCGAVGRYVGLRERGGSPAVRIGDADEALAYALDELETRHGEAFLFVSSYGEPYDAGNGRLGYDFCLAPDAQPERFFTAMMGVAKDTGEEIPFSPYDETQKLLRTYGFAWEHAGKLVVANRVFEMLLCDYFLTEEQGEDLQSETIYSRSRFVRDGRLDMCAVLEGFRRTYDQVFGPLVDRFPEKDGRELFLLYLRPIINGMGNYYIEAQTRDRTRTDVVVDYAGEQFVVELKIWRGASRHEEGEEQLRGYLEHFGLSVGYLLSFNFNKHKETGLKRVVIDGRTLWEETV